MSAQLKIQPFTQPLSAEVRVPGSKSITNRALLLAALCDQPVTLRGALMSRDTTIMCSGLRKLGFKVDENSRQKSFKVDGLGGQIPVAETALHMGNAGTAARFLTAFLALRKGGNYTLDGDPAMRERPMEGLLRFLQHQGTEFEFHAKSWHFPFTMRTHGLKGGNCPVDANASSQILSALLMVAPYAEQPMELHSPGVRPSFVEMTVAMMQQFGVDVSVRTGGWKIANQQHYTLANGDYPIEADASAASYFVALPRVTGGKITLPGLGNRMLQGDVRFAGVMTHLGLSVQCDADQWSVSAPTPLKDLSHVPRCFDMGTFSDTFLTLAALSPLFPFALKIEGIAHTRKQETDRIHAMTTELRKLGQIVTEEEGSILIEPSMAALRLAAEKGVSIETYEDHRVAMSFGILGCYNLFSDGRPWLTINDPACCGKTFPDFFQVLESVRQSGKPASS